MSFRPGLTHEGRLRGLAVLGSIADSQAAHVAARPRTARALTAGG